MNTLNFNTGLVTFSVNNSAEVSFNPSDSTFAKRLYDTFSALAEKQESYEKEAAEAAETEAIFDLADQLDKEMRQMIDTIFRRPVADDIFGDMNVYAYADGLPVWCNFLFAVIDTIDDTIKAEKSATDHRLNKYLSKYHK